MRKIAGFWGLCLLVFEYGGMGCPDLAASGGASSKTISMCKKRPFFVQYLRFIFLNEKEKREKRKKFLCVWIRFYVRMCCEVDAAHPPLSTHNRATERNGRR